MDRFVVLGVARARSHWFRSVAQWATSAALPAEFVKCVSVEELLAHLAGGRAYSAVVVDGGLRAVDRDVIAAAGEAGCPTIVVDDGHGTREWHSLGAAAVLPANFTREQLVEVLALHAATVGRTDEVGASVGEDSGTRLGRVVAVCGPGGTGASTAAIAVAQQFAGTQPDAAPVLLADLALRADQAALHDARDIVPGVQELVEAHRGRRPAIEEVIGLTFDIPERGYHLLLGLRQARYWSAIRPRAFEAAFDSLRRAFGTVVCDVTADFEGQADSGSIDVEERNIMARTAVRQADAVVAVGMPGVKGVHALVRLLHELSDAGVAAARIVPVVNLAPRSPKARAEITAAVAALTDTTEGLASPTFLPRRRVDLALRDGVALPAPLGALLTGAVTATCRRNPPVRAPESRQPQPVVPGTLGSWSPEI